MEATQASRASSKSTVRTLYKGNWKFEAMGNGSDVSFQGIVEKYC